jgi:hypothetical protein
MGFIRDLFGGAERDAARLQAQASDNAIREQRLARDQARGDLQPFTQAGSSALNPLLELINTPQSDFERSQGFEAIQKSAAAGGNLNSGGTLKDLTEFNAGVNERFRGNRFNELFSLANLGQNSAAGQANASILSGQGIADTTVGRGDALAAGRIGSANRIGSTLSGIGSFLGTLKPVRQRLGIASG